MKEYTHVLWDFNGTLFDDANLNFDIINTMLTNHHKNPIEDLKAYRSIFGFPVIDFYKSAGFNFEEASFHDLAIEYMDAYRKGSKQCRAAKNIDSILKKLNQSKIQCSIISAAEHKMLQDLVDQISIRSYFQQIIGLDSIYANSKIELAKKWMIDNHVDPSKLLFIGDTVHDYEVSLALDSDCILTCQGHQSKEILLQCGVPVIEEMLELNKHIKLSELK